MLPWRSGLLTLVSSSLKANLNAPRKSKPKDITTLQKHYLSYAHVWGAGGSYTASMCWLTTHQAQLTSLCILNISKKINIFLKLIQHFLHHSTFLISNSNIWETKIQHSRKYDSIFFPSSSSSSLGQRHTGVVVEFACSCGRPRPWPRRRRVTLGVTTWVNGGGTG
jgi:hypothetical protein